MVSLEGGALVEDGERILGLQLEGVSGSSVVEVVTQARDHQTQTFDLKNEEGTGKLHFPVRIKVMKLVWLCVSAKSER